MKKITLLLLVVLCFLQIYAQNNKATTADIGRISLMPFVPEQIDNMPDAARSMLSNKIGQIVTQNGLGGGIDSRFILTANVVVLTKDITPTAPPMQAYTLEITFYIGDGVEGIKYSSYSVTLKGVGETDTKAYISALKNIKTNDPQYQNFINEGKNKIIAYYNNKCDLFLKDAQSLESQNEFDAAIYKLVSVPNVCKQCYDKCMDKCSAIFIKKMDKECVTNIAKSKTLMLQDSFDAATILLSNILPDSKCYPESKDINKQINDHKCAVSIGEAKGAWINKDINGVSNALKNIPSDSKCYNEAVRLADEVNAWVKEKDNKDWNFKLQEYSDNLATSKQAQMDDISIRHATIQAAKELGVAYCNNQPKSVVYNVRGWW